MREDLLRDYICIKMEKIDVTKVLMDIINDPDVENLDNDRLMVSKIAMNEIITKKDIELIHAFFNKYPSIGPFSDPEDLIRSNFRYLPNRENLQNLIKNKFKSDSLGFECLCYYPSDRSNYFLIALEEYEFRHEIYRNPMLVKRYNSARVRIEWNQIMSIYWNLVSGVNINLLLGEKLKVLNGGVWRNLKEEKAISRIYTKF